MTSALPANAGVLFLNPGSLYFGSSALRLRTLLGSCVAITLWHPARRIGGMCHFVLPSRPGATAAELNAHYADDAMAMFMSHLRVTGTQPTEYEVKVFGGGSNYPPVLSGHTTVARSDTNVATRNIQRARQLLQREGFRTVAEHVGGHGTRNIMFDLWSGDAWLRHIDEAASHPAHARPGDSAAWRLATSKSVLENAACTSDATTAMLIRA